MYLNLKFNVWLEWKDSRLEFQNLREDFYQNQISDEIAAKLWIPQPVFENSYEREKINYVPTDSFIMLDGNGKSKEAPLSKMDEAKMFDPITTNILMKTTHLLKFKCDFDLRYFPFDHQTCFIKVKSKLFLMSFFVSF